MTPRTASRPIDPLLEMSRRDRPGETGGKGRGGTKFHKGYTMPEPRTLTDATLEVAGSALAAIAKLAVLVLVVGIPVVLFVGPSCACSTKADAYRAAMKSDLKYLVTAQEIYFADSLRYGASLLDLDYTASVGVTVELLVAADSAWSASARHPGVSTQCAIFVGKIEPPVPDAEEGEVICYDPS